MKNEMREDLMITREDIMAHLGCENDVLKSGRMSLRDRIRITIRMLAADRND